MSKLAKAVTVETDPSGRIVKTKVVLPNGVQVKAPGPVHLTVDQVR